MAKLWFHSSLGNERELGDCRGITEVNKLIQQFLDDNNFKSYCTKCWVDNKNRTWFDVGSRTEFFIWDKDFNDV